MLYYISLETPKLKCAIPEIHYWIYAFNTIFDGCWSDHIETRCQIRKISIYMIHNFDKEQYLL